MKRKKRKVRSLIDKKICLLSIVLIAFLGPGLSFPLEWKNLHEKADNISLAEDIARAKRKPRSLEDLYILGLLYLNAHEDKEAQKIFDKMVSINPTVVEAHWGRAEVLRRFHNLEESEKLLKEIIQLDPEFAPAYISLAYIKYLESDFDLSCELAKKVINQGNGNVDLTNLIRAHCMFAGSKGMIAYYGGLISKIINGPMVLRHLRKAQRLQPDSPMVLFGLGSYYLLISPAAGRDVDKAENNLKKAIVADPLFPDSYVRLAQFYKLKDNEEKYFEYLEKALALDPQNELALDIKNGICKFICVE